MPSSSLSFDDQNRKQRIGDPLEDWGVGNHTKEPALGENDDLKQAVDLEIRRREDNGELVTSRAAVAAFIMRVLNSGMSPTGLDK